MKQVKIESDDKNVQITCPHCGNWEQTGVDDPRHVFNVIPVISWSDSSEDEVSVNKCTDCNNEFAVEWDYDNEFKND